MSPAVVLGFLSGAIALSYEILWYRAFSFASGSRADTFGLLLGAYLAGIALGSLAVRRVCAGTDPAGHEGRLRGLFLLNLAANALGFAVVPVLAGIVRHGHAWKAGLWPVGLAAAALGSVFPLVSHLWIAPDEKAGRNVAYVYVANILGSTLGSLLTGFLLMDHLSIGGIHVLLGFAGLAMSGLVAACSPRLRLAGGAALLALGALCGALGLRPFDGLYEKLQEKAAYAPGFRYPHVVETKSGVITVNANGQIFGGGIYDGAFNTSLHDDKNSIIRCYALAAMRPAAKDVLMIGLSSGSWATVIANNPSVERFTIIEINSGYLQLLPKYPAVAGLTANRKVTIEIDDGRRWMVRHPERKFDLIVANATFHWRSNATNLLSKEFLELVRSRLNPGGLYYYNTTGSARVLKTGAAVFPHALKVGGFLAVSDAPIELDVDGLAEILYRYPWEGRTVLDRSLPADVAAMAAVQRGLRAMIRTRDRFPDLSASAPVTDDNMGTEWEREPETIP